MKKEDLIKSIDNDSGMLMMRMEVLMEKYALAPLGLSGIQIKILMVLMAQKNVMQSSIAKYVATTPANISKRLSIMAEEGLIKRSVEGDTDDRRKVLISITDSGKRKFTAAFDCMGKIKTYVEKHFTDKELEERAKFTYKLKSVLNQLEVEIDTFFNY